MNAHGKIGPSVVLSNSSALSGSLDDQPLPGFRHFLRTPDDDQRFAIDGVTFDPKQHLGRANELMGKLAGLMVAATPGPRENDTIPSGYTYFLQLLAHDLVNTSLSLSRYEGNRQGVENDRRMPLRLETIYGGGPAQCPFAFESGQAGLRDHLRLGKIRKDNLPFDGTGDLRDIARARPVAVVDSNPVTNRFPKYSEALIPDARNDHGILSQMVVLFHHLHNKILEALESNASLATRAGSFADVQKRFATAQSACILIYRSLIQNDLFPLLLHKEVLKHYRGSADAIMDRPTDLEAHVWIAPIEFAFGFFRFGHSMIRGAYSFNPLTPVQDSRTFNITSVLEHSSATSPQAMPVENKWTIEWSRFFGRNPQTNSSMRIGPSGRMELENAVRDRDHDPRGLTVRDLTSSIVTQPWSLRALVQEISKTHGDLIQLSPLLRDDRGAPHAPPWFNRVKEWLETQDRLKVLQPKDISTLANDPPLPFFARFEAEAEGDDGQHLGILASIMVADVFYGILACDKIQGIDNGPHLEDQLRRLSDITFGAGKDAFAGMGDLNTFTKVINYLGARVAFPTSG